LDRETNLVRLSRREWAVLKVLIGCGGTAIESHQLMDRSLNREDQQGARCLYKYIGRLRMKLELDPQNPRRMILERGRGYRLEGPDSNWPVIIHPDGIFFGDGQPTTRNSPSSS
jgi:DNA-binding response OmpR family regulator